MFRLVAITWSRPTRGAPAGTDAYGSESSRRSASSSLNTRGRPVTHNSNRKAVQAMLLHLWIQNHLRNADRVMKKNILRRPWQMIVPWTRPQSPPVSQLRHDGPPVTVEAGRSRAAARDV